MTSIGGGTTVWMDVTDDNATIPLSAGGQIFAKVSRIAVPGLKVNHWLEVLYICFFLISLSSPIEFVHFKNFVSK